MSNGTCVTEFKDEKSETKVTERTPHTLFRDPKTLGGDPPLLEEVVTHLVWTYEQDGLKLEVGGKFDVSPSERQ